MLGDRRVFGRVAAWLTVGAVLVAGGLGASTASAPAPVAGSAGIGDSYFPQDGNGGIDVLHYGIHDAYAFAGSHVSGTTTLRIRATQALKSFHLDLLLPVRHVTVDGAAAAFSKPDTHELVIRPPRPLAAGQVFTTVVTYAGDPARLKYAGERNWLASGDEVVAMNEPHMAPWWFPSNDHPSDKARFDIAITAPAGMQVISNGVRTGHVVNGTLARTTWHMAQPMTTYLAFFAAGHYVVRHGRSPGGIPVITAVSKGLSAGNFQRGEQLLAKSGAITDWLARELGRYPFASTGGLDTPLDSGFALENQTRPTYSYIDHTTEVHELAHQWFGDDVSLRRWKDVWLNEGFATYMEQRWKEAHGGQSTLHWLHAEYAADRGDRGFWTHNLVNPTAPHIWDYAVYYRGAMALAALRNRIGAKDFKRLLRTWVARYGGRNATTAEFARMAASVSGQHLSGFFHAWLVGTAAPRRTAANGW